MENFFNRIPSVEYCEKATDFFISRPGYAISNLPYIFLGIYLVTRNNILAKLFGVSSIIIGSFSFLYDATFKLYSQIIDQMGMLFFILLLLNLNYFRFRKKEIRFSKFQILINIFVIAILFTITFLTEGSILAILFGGGIILSVLTEIYLIVRTKCSYNHWLAGLIIFLIAQFIWIFDRFEILCDPANIFNGRGIYHYLTTITILLLYLHYKRIFKIN